MLCLQYVREKDFVTRQIMLPGCQRRGSVPIVAPRVTVLLATYNDEPFLAAAIDSVLAQTFADFELLVVIDAATDRSREIVDSYSDRRIRLLVNETNIGLAASLNRGLDTAADAANTTSAAATTTATPNPISPAAVIGCCCF